MKKAHLSRSTTMPLRCVSVAAFIAFVSQSMASNSALPRAGIFTFSSIWPACTMYDTAASCPSTWKHTWFSFSFFSGLFLLGLLLVLGCFGGFWFLFWLVW